MADLPFAFSAAVMRALGRLPTAARIAAMRSIGVAIRNPALGRLCFGTAASRLPPTVTATFADRSGAPWRRLGGLRFVVGAFGVAVVRNVPLDTVLATDTPSGQEGAKRRERYPARRTARNRARTPAAGGAATIPTLALALRSEEEPAPGHRARALTRADRCAILERRKNKCSIRA